MKKTLKTLPVLLMSALLLISLSCKDKQVMESESDNEKIDLVEARKIVDTIDKKFSKHYYDGDSIALYNMYAKGAYYGTLTGEDILSSWGRHIRSSIKNDTRNFSFTPIFLNTDNEYLFEVGKYEFKDSQGNLKSEGKYLMVLKQEDGEWKIYRDMGL